MGRFALAQRRYIWPFPQPVSSLQASRFNPVIRFTSLLILVSCLCRTLAFAQAEYSATFPSEIPEATALFPNAFAGINGAQIDSTAPSSKVNFALEFGRKLLEVKASYFEKRLEEPALLGSASDQMDYHAVGEICRFTSRYPHNLAVNSSARPKPPTARWASRHQVINYP